ncbi:MAG: hypothetical protein HY528_00205 [Chloroflexi bacterium]|nr:hypothetical protein [Chloroflexota bacterium]
MTVRIRKATMTNKERMEALLRRESPDRVPFWPFSPQNFVTVHSGSSIADSYSDAYTPMIAYEAQKKACQEFDWVFTPTFNSRRGLGGAFGGKMQLPTSKYSQAPFSVKFAAETSEEVMALKAPDVKTVACITPEMIDFYKRLSQEKLDNAPFKLMFAGIGVAPSARSIAGAEKMAKWMIKKPEIVHRMFRLAADYQIELAQYYKDTFGVEGVLPTGTQSAVSNNVMSPKHFEQFALPYLKEVHEKVLAMGFKHLWVHLCGEHNLNLPYWQQVPMGDPGIISIGNEIDLETVAKYFTNDIIEGNLDTTIIQIGTPEEVYQAAKKVIEQGKSLTTGFIFSPACQIPPMAPVENVMAMTRAVNDFGWYD